MLFIVETADGNCERSYTSTAIQPCAPLATDWLQNAVNHYVFNFVITPDCGLPGLQNDMPQLYTAFPNTMYFQHALQAVALLNLARINQMDREYLMKARVLHHKAIQGLRVALSDGIEARSATVLMTTELLWQYDVRYP